MADRSQRTIVDGADFGSIFRFPAILRAVTAAMLPPRLVVALLMVVVVAAFGFVWDASTEARTPPGGFRAAPASAEALEAEARRVEAALADHGVTGTGTDPAVMLDRLEAAVRGGPAAIDRRAYEDLRGRIDGLRPRGAFEATAAHAIGAVEEVVRGVAFLEPERVLAAGHDLFVVLPRAVWKRERAFGIAFAVLLLVVVGIGGGALCRMAACDFAGRERIRVWDAFDFALGHWVSLVLTPVLPLLIAGGLALIIAALGLLLAPWVNVVGGVVYGVGVVMGFLLVFVLLGYALGFPLLVPAVACENCDPADAQQRAYAYVLGRPLHYLGYLVVLIAGLALGYVVVAFVAATTLNVTAGLSGAFVDPPALMAAGGFTVFDLAPAGPASAGAAWHEAWAAAAVGFWQRLVIDLVAAYVVAYLFTSSTITYLLMRKACDGQDIEEIWRPGLVPGTMVPLPKARVGAEPEADAG